MINPRWLFSLSLAVTATLGCVPQAAPFLGTPVASGPLTASPTPDAPRAPPPVCNHDALEQVRVLDRIRAESLAQAEVARAHPPDPPAPGEDEYRLRAKILAQSIAALAREAAPCAGLPAATETAPNSHTPFRGRARAVE